VGFPGNPIVKTGRKPLKKGVKNLTFLHLEVRVGGVFGEKFGSKTSFHPMKTGVK
jgi:hypothetical protein